MTSVPAQITQRHAGAAVTGPGACDVSGKCGHVSPVALPPREGPALSSGGSDLQMGRQESPKPSANLSWSHCISGKW